jgi:hypothetical protein
MGQPRIVSQNIRFRPLVCQEFDDEFHGKAGARDYRLADENIGVDRNSFLPTHICP